MILVIAIDKIRRNLRTSIDGENELDGKILPMFALEVNEYTTKKDETIIISSTYPFDLDDLVDKKDADRIKHDEETFKIAHSKAKLTEEQKYNFKNFKMDLRGKCEKFNYNTGKYPAIRTKFEDTRDRGVVLLFANGVLEIAISTIDRWPEKQKKYKEGLEKDENFKKLMKERSGKLLRFQPEEWMPFSHHILSVLEEVFVND